MSTITGSQRSIGLGLLMLSAMHPGNLERCARWRQAQGVEKAVLANQLGAANALTKNQRLAEARPGDTHSLYRTSDLLRLCRSL